MAEEIMESSTWRGRLIRYAPLILWTGVIFVLSSSQGSMAETSRFIRPIIEFFFPSASPETFLLIHTFIRKSAHFVEYAILAIFVAGALSGSSFRPLGKYWYAASVLIVLIVAAVDEINQSANISRTGSGRDVLLDLSGGVTAIFILWMAQNRWPVNRILQNNRWNNRQ